MDHPEFSEPVDWRVTFRDAETDRCVHVRVVAGSSDAAMALAARLIDEGEAGQGNAWLYFDSCESLPDREWAANSGWLQLLQRALQRSDAELYGRHDRYLSAARRVASNVIDRGV